MAKKSKGGKSQAALAEIHDVDYWNKLSTKPTVRLKNGELVSEKEYMKRFIREYHLGQSKKDRTILQTEEQHIEANRNNNSLNRDLIHKQQVSADVEYMWQKTLTGSIKGDIPKEWQEAYHESGPGGAFTTLAKEFCKEVGIKWNYDRTLAIFRLYVKIKKLLRYIRRSEKEIKC